MTTLHVARTYKIEIDTEVLTQVKERCLDVEGLAEAITRQLDVGDFKPLYLVRPAWAKFETETIWLSIEDILDGDTKIYGPVEWDGEEVGIEVHEFRCEHAAFSDGYCTLPSCENYYGRQR